jgi:hypothetical protein
MAVTSRDLPGTTRTHPLTPLLTAVTYALALLALTVLLQHALTWSRHRIDDVRYGMPRRVHLAGQALPADTPAAPTHVITLNLNGQISILVLPNGDAGRAQALAGPYLVGADNRYVVPRPALADLTGDGRADLLVTVRGETLVYVQEGEGFRLLTPEEREAVGREG